MIKKFFKDFKADSPVLPNDFGKIIKVTEKATLPEIFKMLIENQIQAVPVVDSKSNKSLYVVSIHDILEHFVDHFSEEEFKNSDIYVLTLKEELQQHSKVQEAAHLAISVPKEVDLYHVIQLMIQHKVHRVLVYDETGHLINIITQSRVIKLLSGIIDSSPVAKKTIQELNLGTKPVITIHEKETTIQGFKLIKEKKVSAVGVIDDHGKLVGVLSASDLKLIGYNIQFFKYFGECLRDYLARIQMNEPPSEGIPPLVTCKLTDTLADIVRIIVFYRLHRLFVVDKDNKPIAVISLVDILEKVVE